MALSPRKRGQAAVRAKHSRFTRHISTRLAPFFAVETVSGGPLLIATVLALIWINSPYAASYDWLWGSRLGVTLGSFKLEKSLADWARDALLPVFFFGVGIEVKRELVKGLLFSRATAMLPLCCAVGGMVVPAALYVLLNTLMNGSAAHLRGWGTTVTTDTAFALALVGIFGSRLPRAVRVLLLAFAAVDDIGGLMVIAFVYTTHVSWLLLGAAAILFVLIMVLLRLEIIESLPYVLLGLAILMLVEQSGVHASIAGVMLGALVPVEPRVPENRFAKVVQSQVDRFQEAHREASAPEGREDDADKAAVKQSALDKQETQLGQLSETAHATYEPAQRITHGINPWISYVVLPLFALSNAGVHLSGDIVKTSLSNGVALGILAGLMIGKPVGVLLFAWLSTQSGLARIPREVTWRMLSAIAVSSGIGFTISLFISDLAFAGADVADEAKLAVLLASVLSGLFAYVTFRWAVKAPVGRAKRIE